MDCFAAGDPAEDGGFGGEALIFQRVVGFLKSAEIDGDLHVLFATFAAGADVAFPEARVAVHVDCEAALLGELSRQIDRKTKLLVKVKGGFGGDDSAGG